MLGGAGNPTKTEVTAVTDDLDDSDEPMSFELRDIQRTRRTPDGKWEVRDSHVGIWRPATEEEHEEYERSTQRQDQLLAKDREKLKTFLETELHVEFPTLIVAYCRWSSLDRDLDPDRDRGATDLGVSVSLIPIGSGTQWWLDRISEDGEGPDGRANELAERLCEGAPEIEDVEQLARMAGFI